MVEPFAPFTARLPVILAIFAGFLLVFDLVLVRVFKLSKHSWKKVDYFWLGFTALGLIGAVSQVRMSTAARQVDQYRIWARAAFTSLRDEIRHDAANPGPLCRQFVRTEYSPPPEQFQKAQEEFNSACEWAQKADRIMASRDVPPLAVMDVEDIPPHPQFDDKVVADVFQWYDQQLSSYNKLLDNLAMLRHATAQTEGEEYLALLSPVLLSMALALRITKVTGELRAG